MELLDDSSREFVSSEFLKLELLPKCTYLKKFQERDFYLDFFGSIVKWVKINKVLTQKAMGLAEKYGLSAVDALHFAAAESLKAEEFITLEKSHKPFFKIESKIKIISLR